MKKAPEKVGSFLYAKFRGNFRGNFFLKHTKNIKKYLNYFA